MSDEVFSIESRDQLFNLICGGNDREVDPQVKDRLREFLGKANDEVKDPLLGLIDDCVFCSLTSDAVICCLNFIWEQLGGTVEELQARRATIADPDKAEELQKKYQWRT